MKISVLGAGAIGGMFGGLIKHHVPELDVLLVVRGEHGRAIRERGHVRLNGPWGSRQVATDTSFRIEDIAGSDLVLLTTKSQSTEEAMLAAQPYLGDAIVLSIQNGINDSLLAQFVPPERLVMGMTATNMAVLEPGSVSLQLNGATVVGPSASQENFAAAAEAARWLRRSGLRIVEHPNTRGVRYNKLAINALGYASCMSQSNFITEALCHKGWRETVGLPIVNECIVTLARAGITLSRIPAGPDIRGLRRVLHVLGVPLAGRLVAFGARQLYNKKPIVFSLYQDLLRDRATEVDFVNGQLVRLAAEHGLEAVHNSRVVDMVHELEQQVSAKFFTRDEVIDRFQNSEGHPHIFRASEHVASTEVTR